MGWISRKLGETSSWHAFRSQACHAASTSRIKQTPFLWRTALSAWVDCYQGCKGRGRKGEYYCLYSSIPASAIAISLAPAPLGDEMRNADRQAYVCAFVCLFK